MGTTGPQELRCAVSSLRSRSEQSVSLAILQIGRGSLLKAALVMVWGWEGTAGRAGQGRPFVAEWVLCTVSVCPSFLWLSLPPRCFSQANHVENPTQAGKVPHLTTKTKLDVSKPGGFLFCFRLTFSMSCETFLGFHTFYSLGWKKSFKSDYCPAFKSYQYETSYSKGFGKKKVSFIYLSAYTQLAAFLPIQHPYIHEGNPKEYFQRLKKCHRTC